MFRLLVTLSLSFISSGCTTSADIERKTLQMEAYRAHTNKVLGNTNFQNVLREKAREDAEYERVYAARIKDLLDKKTVNHPKIKKNVGPVYPLEMRKEWREALLYFALIVTPDGRISSLRYLPLPGLETSETFVQLAKSALEKWEFEPGDIDGVSSEFAFIVPVRFSLK